MSYADKKEATRNQNRWISEKYDRINLTVPKGQKDLIQAYAEWHGVSTNRLIWTLIKEELERNCDICDKILEAFSTTADPRFPKMKDLREE